MWARRLPRNAAVKAAVESGLCKPDEVRAGVQLVKYNPGYILLFLVGIIPGFIFVLGVQRGCFLLVTDREVIVSPFYGAWGAKRAMGEAMKLERPVQVALAEDPKPVHNFGNKLQLPREIAEFLGTDTVYAQMGRVADDAFGIARAPTESASKAPAEGSQTLQTG
jgi:hypothetical protein